MRSKVFARGIEKIRTMFNTRSHRVSVDLFRYARNGIRGRTRKELGEGMGMRVRERKAHVFATPNIGLSSLMSAPGGIVVRSIRRRESAYQIQERGEGTLD